VRVPWLLVPLTVAVGSAAADTKDKDRADTLFKQGKTLMTEQRYAEACEAFEASFKLDPGIGVELNVAKCYEEWGKLRRAFRAYQQADQMAKDANDAREPKIADLVAQIEPQVPKLTIKLSADAASHKLVVLVDGEKLEERALGAPRQVDPGPHVIEWTADAGPKQTKVVAVARASTSEVVVDLPHDSATAAIASAPHGGFTSNQQRIAAYASGIGGVVLLGVSSYLALSAKSQYDHALKVDCGGQTDMCDPTGLTQTHNARTKANIATGVFIGGVVAVGAGVALYVLALRATHGEHALRVVPQTDGHGAGLALGGQF
jgi:tetratricopeptide (TPR) repeat protein